MKRIASIHLLETDLKRLLKSHFKITNETQVNTFISDAKKYAANKRNVLVTNQKLERQSQKMLVASTGDTMVMAKTIYNLRKQMKHVGVSIAKAGDRDWSLIKTIAANAVEFCNEFQLSKSEGFKDYILVGAEKMSKFTLTKFSVMHQSICEAYVAKKQMLKDNHPSLTERAYKEYNYHIVNQLGSLLVDYKTIPEKYVCFILVAEKCFKLGITPETYIKAQFAGLEWAKGIPDPLQLYGDKANERLQKYLYQNSEKPDEEEVATDKTLINKMKNLRRKRK